MGGYPLDDGGFILAGFVETARTQESDGTRKAATWHIDSAGNILSTTVYGGETSWSFFSNPQPDANGDGTTLFHLQGRGGVPPKSVAVLDAEGSVKETLVLPDWVIGIANMKGGFLFWGSQPKPTYSEGDRTDSWESLGFMDAAGEVLWTAESLTAHIGTDSIEIMDIDSAFQMEDDMVLIGTAVKEEGDQWRQCGFVLRMDRAGDVKWVRATEGDDEFHGGYVDGKQSLALVGSRCLRERANLIQGIMVRIDGDGSVQWQEIYPWNEKMYLHAVEPVWGGYVVGGGIHGEGSLWDASSVLMLVDDQGKPTGDPVMLPDFRLMGFLRQADGTVFLLGNALGKGILLPLSAWF